MRVRIHKGNADIRNEEEEDNKVLINKKSLDRLILDVLDEMLQETALVMEEPSQMRAEGACSAKGFYRLDKILQVINAINLSEKGKLYAKSKK